MDYQDQSLKFPQSVVFFCITFQQICVCGGVFPQNVILCAIKSIRDSAFLEYCTTVSGIFFQASNTHSAIFDAFLFYQKVSREGVTQL